MTKHITHWLQAHYDGELDARVTRRVEAHLETCRQCRAELADLETLSALLQTAPAVTATTTQEQFAARVALHLPRQDHGTLTERAFEWGWRLAPVLLVTMWLFVQTVSILTTGILALANLGLGDGQWVAVVPSGGVNVAIGPRWATSLLNLLGVVDSVPRLTELNALSWLEPITWFSPLLLVNVILATILTMAVASWLTIGWAKQQPRNGHQIQEPGS